MKSQKRLGSLEYAGGNTRVAELESRKPIILL